MVKIGAHGRDVRNGSYASWLIKVAILYLVPFCVHYGSDVRIC